MTTINVQITLPDDLAQRASADGLLNAQAIERMVRRELSQRQRGEVGDLMDRLHSVEGPPPALDEIAAEIHAHRAGKRGSGAPCLT